MLRFMEPNAENDPTDRMTSHGQYSPADQDGEVPQSRGGEASEKMERGSLKGLWQISKHLPKQTTLMATREEGPLEPPVVRGRSLS